MSDFTEIECPFCGAGSTVFLEAMEGEQTLVTDCENCCRPMTIVAEFDDSGLISLDVRGQ